MSAVGAPAAVLFDSLTYLYSAMTLRRIRIEEPPAFRRLVEANALVEPTGANETATGGRPAALYRFRREAIAARGQGGTKVPIPRSR